MIKAIKAIVVSASLIVALAASTTTDVASYKQQLQLDDLYVCSFWPTCRDPDEQKPAPSDSSAPKPSGDKDTTKDNKDEAQLA
ncbi:hypothetical protein [Arsukibacterium sp.]|uniref:hypothetical protein n=1 Tax=Arsukibacterium sp. TaxID=1977258 RepID=UPI001BD65D43|nr:hypothetical protein [Arsukibacterium sp.]